MKRIISYIMCICILLSTMSYESFGIVDANITFEDDNFKNALISAGVDTNSNGEISVSEAEGTTYLSLYYKYISDISGIEYFTNLTTLYLHYNSISDVSDLSGLTKLTTLYLYSNDISDISDLSGLTNLTTLNLGSNDIVNISALENLTNLTNLTLNYNDISDISPIANLSTLRYLYLSGNEIVDISPVEGLTNLTTLYATANDIVDIEAIDGLTNLSNLSLYGNDIVDISPVAGLTNLISLELSYNDIVNISPVANLTNLTGLYTYSNDIVDISPIANLTNLTCLNLSYNDIVDISPLEKLVKLQTIYLQYNDIVDISVISNLTSLKNLYIYSNEINDLSAIKDLTSLANLQLYNNSITQEDLINLSNLTTLTSLNLNSNELTDISDLGTLTSLTSLGLDSTGISDISPLANLTALTNLDIDNNDISSLTPLLGLVDMQYLYATYNEINSLSGLENMVDLIYLNASYNDIEDVSALKDLTSLDYLYLYHNEIEDISSLENLTGLYYLYLHNNNIGDISALSGLNLASLSLYNNPLYDEDTRWAVHMESLDFTVGTTEYEVWVIDNTLNNDLADLSVSEVTLSPEFDVDELAYSTTTEGVISVKVTPTVDYENATVTVDNEAVISGTSSAAISLVSGENTISVVVTPEDTTADTKTYTITINNIVTLSDLTLSDCTLSDGFSSAVTSYTASVDNSVTYTTVMPVATTSSSSITVNDELVTTSGSINVDLNVGDNEIEVEVIAADESSSQVYTVLVTRAASSDATLFDLAISEGSLSPNFDSSITSYTASVDYDITELNVTPTLSTTSASVKVDDTTVTSGTSQGVELNEGYNTIEIEATAEDGTILTYTIVVERAYIPELSGLVVSEGTLSPSFDSGTTDYEVDVENSVSEIAITPTFNDDHVYITYKGDVLASDLATDIELSVGENTIPMIVTNEEGDTRTYNVVVTRAASSDANLSHLALSQGSLSPEFNSSVISYSASVDYTVDEITIIPTVNDDTASVLVDNKAAVSGDDSEQIALSVGENSIEILVTAEDGTTKTYTVVVTRAPSSDASLANVELSEGSLTSEFDSSTVSYSVFVDYSDREITITPTSGNEAATITVNGTSVLSGEASEELELSVGENTITIIVIAQDDVTTTTYTLLVDRDEKEDDDDDVAVTSEATESEDEGITVIVNGVSQTAGTENTTEEDGVTTVTLTVDSDTLEDKIDQILSQQEEGDDTDNIIEIPVSNTDSNVVETILTGDIVDKMEDDDFLLSIITEDIQYIIPAEEIGINQVADVLDVEEDSLESIEVEVIIKKLDDSTIEEIEEQADVQEFEILFPPVEFTVVAKTTSDSGEEKETTISKFNSYVERVMEIPSGIDPSKIKTGVVYNADGTFSHIPTEIFEEDGVYYAKLSSLTNSTYSVIWNNISVASVSGHWSESYVNDMASRLIIKDPENFAPDDEITRGEFAEYITKAIGIYRTGVATEDDFTDVDITDELADAITIATEYGVIKGYPDGTFKSDESITREEAMVIFARVMDLIDLEEVDTDRILSFSDSSMVSDWADEESKKVLSVKIFNGNSDNTLNPKGLFTYAEAATAIRNMLIEAGLINE